MRDATLKSLKYADLYERLFDQSSEKASSQDLYNVLLLVLLVMTYAVDTSICERGFATMNLLKTKKRSCMRNELLRDLMTVCELGKDWKDPSKIPVKYRSRQSSRSGATSRSAAATRAPSGSRLACECAGPSDHERRAGR